MTVRYRFFQCLGAVAVVAGCLFALAVRRMLMRGQPQSAWDAGDEVLVGAVAAFLIYVGQRALQFGDSKEKPTPRFRWGRILFGLWLVFVIAKNHFHPAPNLLKPDNEAEALGMNVAAIAMSIAGVMSIVWGFLPRSTTPHTIPQIDTDRA